MSALDSADVAAVAKALRQGIEDRIERILAAHPYPKLALARLHDLEPELPAVFSVHVPKYARLRVERGPGQVFVIAPMNDCIVTVVLLDGEGNVLGKRSAGSHDVVLVDHACDSFEIQLDVPGAMVSGVNGRLGNPMLGSAGGMMATLSLPCVRLELAEMGLMVPSSPSFSQGSESS